MHHSPTTTAQPAAATGKPDLGYHWLWTYGHLIPAGIFAAVTAALAWLGLPWWAWVVPTVLAVWSIAAFLVMRLGVRMNEIPRFSANDFLPGGKGRVLDVGCGSGRMSIALGRARPSVKIVGLDNFSADYIRSHGAPKTERNFHAAGIADRATIESGDMRDMSFDADSFDAAMSSAAIDYLQPDDIRKTLSEVQRVVSPGGQLLLMVTVPNTWLRIAFGPMIGRMQGRGFWREALMGAGFRIEREATVRTMAMFMARKP